MKKLGVTMLLFSLIVLGQAGCSSTPASDTVAPSTTAVPQGRTIVVSSAADSGPGTLRQALLDAQSGDTITFDTLLFPPDDPTTVVVTTTWAEMHALPPLSQGHVTLDASDAGVIIDGSHISGEWVNGVTINSDWNTVRGLQIVGFPGAGLIIGDASNNVVGGSRETGAGPSGQGNVLSRNKNGIDLNLSGANNTIAGNFIGTNPSGSEDLGNEALGIWIEAGQTHTVVGPNNVIAFNGGPGVRMSVGDGANTVTQNSIHDNLSGALEFFEAAPILSPPVMLEVNLTAGTIRGYAGPGYRVEFFSDAKGQAAVYEGYAVADATGTYRFDKRASFTGPRVLALAIDTQGNTGALWGAVAGMQKGNASSVAVIETRRSGDLEENHIGGDYDAVGQAYEEVLESIQSLGLKWVRTNFWSPNPLNWQEVLRPSGLYEVPEDCDDFISALVNSGVTVVLTLSAGAGLDGSENGWWGGPGWGMLGNREPQDWFKTQESRDAFAAYARFMAQHFKGRVEYYEIWNEPECGVFPGDPRGAVALENYVALIKQVAPAIRETDPEAKIVVGVLGRLYEDRRTWLKTVLASGVAPLVDAVSWHPFYGESPLLYSGESADTHPDPFYWQDYPATAQDFMKQLASLGFDGDYMAEEMVWRTFADLGTQELPLYTDVAAAKYLARAIVLHRALGFQMVSSQFLAAGESEFPPKYYVLRNLCTVMSGAEPADLPVSIESAAKDVKYCSFALSGGASLVALWTDGEAVDDDPGVEATVTITGDHGGEATAVDALNGIEQRLVATDQAGALVIEGFLLKDYPLFIRVPR